MLRFVVERIIEKCKEVATNRNGVGVRLKLETRRFSYVRSRWWCMRIKWHILEWRSHTSCAWTCESCPIWVKGIQIVKPGSTLFVGVFVTFIRCGDQNLQARLEMDSKEKRDDCKGEFGEDARSECIGWKQKTHLGIPPTLRTQRHIVNGFFLSQNN
jgi:hypothetical protein